MISIHCYNWTDFFFSLQNEQQQGELNGLVALFQQLHQGLQTQMLTPAGRENNKVSLLNGITTFFMTWIRRYKQKQTNKKKKVISKIPVDSNLTFSSYAW